MAYIDVVDPAGELVHAGVGLRFPRRSAAEILAKLEKFGAGLLVKEDGSVVDDDDVVDSPCVYRLIPCSHLGPDRSPRAQSGEMEEVMRSVDRALRRQAQLIEILIRSGVKISHNNTNGNNPTRYGGPDYCRGGQARSPEPQTGSPSSDSGPESSIPL